MYFNFHEMNMQNNPEQYLKRLKIVVPSLPNDFQEKMTLRAIYSGKKQDPKLIQNELASVIQKIVFGSNADKLFALATMEHIREPFLSSLSEFTSGTFYKFYPMDTNGKTNA